jgi:excisionase family DNA binding protein
LRANVPRLAYSPEEASFALGVCRATIYNWMDAGILPSTKVAGRRFIPAAPLEALVTGEAASPGDAA